LEKIHSSFVLRIQQGPVEIHQEDLAFVATSKLVVSFVEAFVVVATAIEVDFSFEALRSSGLV
jgi:hypothetical protein